MLIPGARTAKAGEQLADPGFVSTSVSPAEALKFGGDTVMEIRIPAGFNAAWTDDLFGRFGAERELLLPRGLTFKVLSATERNGLRHLILEIRP